MNHFKKAAPTWDTPEKIKTTEEYAKKIKSFLKSSGPLNILEVGCGTGLLGSHFVDDKNSLLGVDTSAEMLQVFKEKFAKNQKVRSLLLNLEENNLQEKNFDLIISSMAFHHLKDPFSVLKKLQKMLAPGGMIAVVDLDKEDGSFHPDPKAMGVHHFGFEKKQLLGWGSDLQFRMTDYEIIKAVNKNEKNYQIFLAVYMN